MSKQIIAMLDQLADCQAGRDAIAMAKQVAIDSILTPEIRQQLADIDTEFGKALFVLKGQQPA